MMRHAGNDYTNMDQPPPGNFSGSTPINAGGSSWNFNQNSNQFQNQEMGMPTDEHGNFIVPQRGQSWDDTQSSSQPMTPNYPQSFTQQLSEQYNGNHQFSLQTISQPCGSSGQMSYQNPQYYNQTTTTSFNQMPVMSSTNQGAPVVVDENWSGVTKSDQLPAHHLLVEMPSSSGDQTLDDDSNEVRNLRLRF